MYICTRARAHTHTYTHTMDSTTPGGGGLFHCVCVCARALARARVCILERVGAVSFVTMHVLCTWAQLFCQNGFVNHFGKPWHAQHCTRRCNNVCVCVCVCVRVVQCNTALHTAMQQCLFSVSKSICFSNQNFGHVENICHVQHCTR